MASSQVAVSQGRTLYHLIKAAVFGWLGALFLLGILVPLALNPEERPSGAGLIALVAVNLVLGWLMGTAFSRNLHALFARPHLRLSPEGIALRYWPATRLSLAMFRPTYKIVERFVPWPEYLGCRTFTRDAALPFYQYKSLILETTAGEHEIGRDVFRPPVQQLQQTILDYQQEQFYQPEREAADVAEFCRLRFRTPVRIVSTVGPSTLAWAVGLLATVVASLFFVVTHFGSVGATRFGIWLVVALVLAVIGVELARKCLRGWGQRVLELRAESLALGPSPDKLRLVPWQDILFVRAATKTLQGTTSKEITSLEVRLRNAASIRLYPYYRYPAENLQDLLDPPAEKVAEAYQRMEQGEDVEMAAVAAGLPPRPNPSA